MHFQFEVTKSAKTQVQNHFNVLPKQLVLLLSQVKLQGKRKLLSCQNCPMQHKNANRVSNSTSNADRVCFSACFSKTNNPFLTVAADTNCSKLPNFNSISSAVQCNNVESHFYDGTCCTRYCCCFFLLRSHLRCSCMLALTRNNS